MSIAVGHTSLLRKKGGYIVKNEEHHPLLSAERLPSAVGGRGTHLQDLLFGKRVPRLLPEYHALG